MKLNDLKSNDYFKLFVIRESRVVFGVRNSNLWLLATVLFVTFIAIAFSNASLFYLSDKMNDPFTNWVNIENDSKGGYFDKLRFDLADPQNMERFHYKECSYDEQGLLNIYYGQDNDTMKYFRVRYFENMATDLMRKVLSAENVIKGQALPYSRLMNNTLGVVVTADMLQTIGYDTDKEEAPAYLYYAAHSNIEARDLGFRLSGGRDNDFAHTPIPILGVVRKLPMNMDMIGSRYLKEQIEGGVLNMNNREYASRLFYFVPRGIDVDMFQARLKEIADQKDTTTTPRYVYPWPTQLDYMRSHREGAFVGLSFELDSVAVDAILQIDKQVTEEFASRGVERVFKYAVGDHSQASGRYISLNFSDLDKIREFEKFARDEYQVKIEMAQVNSKENFNQVSVMANVLSWSMIVFAIVCIMLFIVNLLSSYFQKVKRNLGTFKAFGVSNRDLISVYMLIIFSMISMAVIIAFSATMVIEHLLPIVGVLKEGEYDYLQLWRTNTFVSILVIIAASVFTVYVVMRRLLKATPGDLIYDRQ